MKDQWQQSKKSKESGQKIKQNRQVFKRFIQNNDEFVRKEVPRVLDVKSKNFLNMRKIQNLYSKRFDSCIFIIKLTIQWKILNF